VGGCPCAAVGIGYKPIERDSARTGVTRPTACVGRAGSPLPAGRLIPAARATSWLVPVMAQMEPSENPAEQVSEAV
jgi:hypothetical protein